MSIVNNFKKDKVARIVSAQTESLGKYGKFETS